MIETLNETSFANYMVGVNARILDALYWGTDTIKGQNALRNAEEFLKIAVKTTDSEVEKLHAVYVQMSIDAQWDRIRPRRN